MPTDDSQGVFGCPRCWPEDAAAAWTARGMLGCQAELIDESHYHVMILACGGCMQRFLSVFTETVDWVDGEDPQYWTLLPITEAEAAHLAMPSTAGTRATFEALGPGRRSLRCDHPKDEESRVYWAFGIRVGMHD